MFKQNKQKAREALEREAQKGQGFGPRVQLWNPSDGDNKIRIMPPWTDQGPNAEQCWREVHQHWVTDADGNRRPYICPAKTPDAPPGLPCALCAEYERLKQSNDALDQEKAGDLRAKNRFFSSIVDMDDPVYTEADLKEWMANEHNKGKDCPFEVGDTKVQMWSYGPTIFSPLLSLVSDEGANVLDFDEGYNIIVTKSGKGKNNTEYRVRPEFKASKFHFQSSKPQAEWLPDLDKSGLLQLPDPKDLQNVVAELRLAAGEGQEQLGAGQRAPGLPPRSEPEQKRQSAPTSAPKPQQPAKPPADEDKPPCFADREVHSEEDAECVGGKKKNDQTGKLETYDPCPFFGECKKAIFGEPEAPPPRRGRRPVSSEAQDGVKNLEDDMRRHLGGGK